MSGLDDRGRRTMTVDTLGRAIQLYRRTATTRSAALLLAANAIPVIGVLFLGWSLITILVLYWLENGIVGFWNILKINLTRGSFVPQLADLPEAAARAATRNAAQTAALRQAWQEARRQRAAAAATRGAGTGTATVTTGDATTGPLMRVGRLALSLFFLFHYGMFWLVHGVFVFALPAFGNGFGADGAESAFGEVSWDNVLVGGVALFLSHGASFLFNYIGRGEYMTASPSGLMGSVYGRVVVLHLTIIFGSFVVGLLGAPIGALLILVILKTGFDLGLHLRERRTADARIPAGTAYGQIIRDAAQLHPVANAPMADAPAAQTTQSDKFQSEQR
jgi:hypothetical protein